MTSRRILMICYHYLPANNGGVNRSRAFIRYLPSFGWHPVVITTNLMGKADLPDTYHTYDPWRLHRLFKRESTVGGQPNNGPTTPKPFSKSIKQRLIDFIYTWVFVPDRQILWAIFALIPALLLIRRHKINVLYSTSPPVSSHLLGLALSWFTGKPWVLDLRDPWTFEAISPYSINNDWRYRVEKWLEKRCVKRASIIIANTPAAALHYQEIYPTWAHKILAITNGYDAERLKEAIETINQAPATLQFGHDVRVISHIGNFSRYTDAAAIPTLFLQALRSLLDSGAITQDTTRVVFAGNIKMELVAAIAKYDLQSIVVLPGQITHIDALRLAVLSDVLLVYDPPDGGQTYVRGKVYEYLGARKRILALIPDGGMRDLLAQVDLAVLAYPDDLEEVLEALGTCLNQAISIENTVDSSNPYEYRNITQKLAQILDTLSN